MATQAAVLAGFTTTCLIEIDIPEQALPLTRYFLQSSAIISICSNIACVSISTMVIIWGSGKALRGRDGSMDEAVDGMANERALIFQLFAIGLAFNLCSVLSVCLILIDFPVCMFAIAFVCYIAYVIGSNSYRIQKKFFLAEAVRLDDLTQYAVGAMSSVSKAV